MPIYIFCDNFLIACLKKRALLDNACILMGVCNIIAYKQCHFKVFRSNDFLFFVPYIQQPTLVNVLSTTLSDNIFMNSLEFVTVLGNSLCHLAAHLLQFLVLKDSRVS